MLQKQKECILNPSRIILMLYNMFLNDITKKISDEAVDRYPSTVELVPESISLKKCVIEQFIDDFLYLIIFLINKKSKK